MFRGGRLLLILMAFVQPNSPFKFVIGRGRRESLADLCDHCDLDLNTNNGREERHPLNPPSRHSPSYYRQRPLNVDEQDPMASGTADLDYAVLNPKDFPKRDYRRGYLINAEKKLQRKERSNPDEARFNVVFQQYNSRSKRKRFKPYTNENCYNAMRLLQIRLENKKQDFLNIVSGISEARRSRIQNIDQARPKLFILKAWQNSTNRSRTPRRSSRHRRPRSSRDPARLCKKHVLHRQARALDIQIDWIVEDNRSKKSVIDKQTRGKVMNLLYNLASEISDFSYIHLDEELLHASCRYEKPMPKSHVRSSATIDMDGMRSVNVV